MSSLEYHLNELAIARDPARPQHSLPDVSTAEVGIADIGCGIGQLFLATGSQIRSSVRRIGFDVDVDALTYAGLHRPGVANFCAAAAEHLPIASASIDLYVSRVSLPYTDIRQALREAARVLVPGGRLWATLHPWSMVMRGMADAVRGLNLKAFVAQAIQLANGASFHAAGWPRRPFIVDQTWQSAYRMRRLLTESGFDRIEVRNTPGLFLVQARRSV